MLNQSFKDNWNELLKFNSLVEISESPESLDRRLRIPLTPIDLDGFLLYNLYLLYWPKFINSQNNDIDIIVSDYDVENFVLNAYFHESDISGIYKKTTKLPSGSFLIKKDDLKDIVSVFRKVEEVTLNKTGKKINSLRIIRKRAIDLINTHCDNLEKFSFLQFLESFLQVLQRIIRDNLIIFHPQPITLRFLKQLLEIIELDFSKIIIEVLGLLSNHKIGILSEYKDFSFLTRVELKDQSLNLKIFKNKEEDQVKLCYDYDISNLISINLTNLTHFMQNLFDYKLPFSKEASKLLLQKVLYGMRSIDKEWQIYPKSKLYNPLMRWFLRIFGYNLNFRKISHWNIPEFFFNLLFSRVGLNSSILILLTDVDKLKGLNNSVINAVVLNIRNGQLTKLRSIDLKDLAGNDLTHLKEIKLDLHKLEVPTNLIIKIDIKIIKELLSQSLLKINELNALKLYRILKKFKKEQYFEIYPEFPEYKLFKNKRFSTFLKLMLSISIDKHEF